MRIKILVSSLAAMAQFCLYRIRRERTRSPYFMYIVAALLSTLALADCAARELTVGVYQNPPKIFFDKNGIASGIHIDLIRQIAEREKWQLRFVSCEWKVCLRDTEAGLIDLLPDVAYSDEREKIFQFSLVPALYSWSILYRNRHIAVNSIFDLKRKKIAFLENSVQASYFRTLIENSGIKIDLVPIQSLEPGFEMVAAGKADGIIASQQAGDMLAERYGLSDTNIIFQPVKLFFVSAKNQRTDVLTTIDQYLSEWQANPKSVYFEILKKWGRGGSGIPAYVWWLLAGTFALLACASAIAAYLRREVARRTRKLMHSEESLRIAATAFQSSEAIWVMGSNRHVLDANAAFTELTGYRQEEITQHGMPPCRLEHDTQDFRENIWDLVDRERKWNGELLVSKKDGTEFFAMVTLTAVADPNGKVTHYVGTQTDISRQKKLQEEARQLALYDPLTGLPNRRLLMEKIQAATEPLDDQSMICILFFIDVDNFKDLNDTLGHHIGDLLLKKIAERLLLLTADDGFVARLGGDEFVVLLHDIERDRADQVAKTFAQQIIAVIEQRFELDGFGYFETCSIGVAPMFDRAASVQDLLRQGDLAMYTAKKNGRNTFCLFDMNMEHALHFRIGLEGDLRRAIDRGEFELHYQQQRNQAGALIGVEALARWQSPFRGNVSPGIFIPVAEASGLILSLGQWVFEEACRQSVQWNANDGKAPIIIAVNVSAAQVRQPGFVDGILHTLEKTGACASHLKLELTESVMVDDVQTTIEKMLELKRHGLALSLDDFGTGYSSLSLLKRLPLDQLKIDQSFVRDLLITPSDVAIAKSIIALGDAMGLEVIAEGVETIEQQEFLASLGCSCYQGYLFGRPSPPSQFDFAA